MSANVHVAKSKGVDMRTYVPGVPKTLIRIGQYVNRDGVVYEPVVSTYHVKYHPRPSSGVTATLEERKAAANQRRDPNAACEVCGSRRELRIDHDHRTGRLRGILCSRHNADLAVIENADERMALEDYLRRYGCR